MREGTNFAIDRIVRGPCEVETCTEANALLYAPSLETLPDVLMCSSHSRMRAVKNPVPQACDSCGATGNVWRDPISRKNEYLCINCHDPDALFQNRWANKARESKPLHDGAPRAVCEAAGYGTDCKGEIKWRGSFNKQLCNKHAGKQGVGPNG